MKWESKHDRFNNSDELYHFGFGGSHKYKSKKFINGKWHYIYDTVRKGRWEKDNTKTIKSPGISAVSKAGVKVNPVSNVNGKRGSVKTNSVLKAIRKKKMEKFITKNRKLQYAKQDLKMKNDLGPLYSDPRIKKRKKK